MESSEKLTVTLPEDMVRSINDKVDAGVYGSADDIIRNAVRLWQRHEEESEERLGAIGARIRRSLADARPDISMEESFARLSALHAEYQKR
jgi:antitoxin ParD1/3/4